MTNNCDQLTPSQRKVVEHYDGPVLVLAGPGSGKTRVITRRIARLLERGVPARQILAITFTNKAADEMAHRLDELAPGQLVFVSTFHRFCARMLRKWAGVVGLKQNFTIYDTADQAALIRGILAEHKIDATHFQPTNVLSKISQAKNALATVDDLRFDTESRSGDALMPIVSRVFPEYQRALADANAVDFDDLLLHMVTILTENAEIRAELDDRFRYVLVDEYQDTNLAQYQIVAAISQQFPNVCATGDPDQSIYGWRGARLDNILRFESDFPNARVVRLEENFRSTKNILAAADRLIHHNRHRKAKTLITDNPEGIPPALLTFANAKHEAESIAAEIRRAVESGDRRWQDFAICYRVNALSRQLEQAMRTARIPYQVAAGLSFYERAEVKDLLAYLRLIYNPDDIVAFRRIINVPARQIGKTTQGRLADWAQQTGRNLLDAARHAHEMPRFSKRAVKALQNFAAMVDEWCDSLADNPSPSALMRRVDERVGYLDRWKSGETEEERQRLANVHELFNAALEYEASNPENATLGGFLETTSLVNEVDNVDETAGQVTLLTLHAAKGLEFPVVYIVGVEHNLLPHERATRDWNQRAEEEERRLLFVGMTRAMEQLYLTQTRRRAMRGIDVVSAPSIFLREVALDPIDHSMEVLDSSTVQYAEMEAVAPAKTTPNTPPQRTSRRKPPSLTTAADLQAGESKRVDLPQGFAVGAKVRHPQLGPGVVTQTGGFGRRRTVTVEFIDGSTHSYVQSKCPLQPLDLTD